jgi:hypothetical protein
LKLSFWVQYFLRLKKKNSVFGSVVVVAFQITFRVKIHVNDIFSFFKNHFWHQHIKTIQNIQIILNFNKKKFKFFDNAATATFPNIFNGETSRSWKLGVAFCVQRVVIFQSIGSQSTNRLFYWRVNGVVVRSTFNLVLEIFFYTIWSLIGSSTICFPFIILLFLNNNPWKILYQ